MCGQLPFDDRLFWFEEWLFGVVARAVLCLLDALVPAFDGADPACEAAIAAPLPTVSTTAAEASRSVRFGLRMDLLSSVGNPGMEAATDQKAVRKPWEEPVSETAGSGFRRSLSRSETPALPGGARVLHAAVARRTVARRTRATEPARGRGANAKAADGEEGGDGSRKCESLSHRATSVWFVRHVRSDIPPSENKTR